MNSILSEAPGSGSPTPRFSPTGLERLDVSPPAPQTADEDACLGQMDWDEIHWVVQGIFGAMANRIHRRCLAIRSQGARTSGRSFSLFTYRVFNLTGDEESESVIVGLIFEPTSTGAIAVRGDIGGEESGRTDFELDERVVAGSRSYLLPMAAQMAMQLGEQVELVVRSVLERHPPPTY